MRSVLAFGLLITLCASANAATVRRQIAHYGLAEIVDEIVPLGCIMAGEWQRNPPWRRGRRAAAPTSDEG